MAATATPRAYADFVPPHSLREEPGMVSLRVDLSGEGMRTHTHRSLLDHVHSVAHRMTHLSSIRFRKEQIRVQIDNFGRLRITGERPLGADGNRWRRFGKDFQVPDTCDAAAIRARLDKDGILLITMPKLSAVAAAGKDKEPKAPGANTGAEAARQDQTAGHTSSAHQPGGAPHPPPAAPAAEAEEEGDQEDAGGAESTERHDQDEQHSTNDAVAPSDARLAAYGFAKDRRRMVWAIFAVVLALLGAGLYARYRLMDPSAETLPSGNHIVSLSSDS
ncbi:hypothetical protein BAE44_0000024 [Dichanthelium oligosanthes]|uniref:SHSP domain-containing protein n=1 Tax=Dichanthelium oligosanthes TaxID=888268 RepID=A0A1E5WNI7_9POAL|nr:hypothetical protein BAE44_0000024 [Dichanthelium oligosanthes]